MVDVFKLIFAIAVVIIHTQLYSKCSDSFIWFLSALFTRLAVPFFMITSSYFLGIKIKEKGFDAFREYRKTLWPKLLFWGTLAIILNAIVWYKTSIDYFKTPLSVIQQILFYPKGAMWFILALIVSSYILEFFLKKKVSVIVVAIIALGLFIFALICNNYFFVIENSALGGIIKQYMHFCISARNGVFLFIYMFIGYTISSGNLMKLDKKTYIIIVVFGYALLLSESMLLHGVTTLDDSSLFISYLILVPGLLLLLLKFDLIIPHHKDMRNLSGVMYYTHPLFNLLLGTYLGMEYGIWIFLIVLSLTVIVWICTKKGEKTYVKKILG